MMLLDIAYHVGLVFYCLLGVCVPLFDGIINFDFLTDSMRILIFISAMVF